jgi:CheY-like chemotaxis protein
LLVRSLDGIGRHPTFNGKLYDVGGPTQTPVSYGPEGPDLDGILRAPLQKGLILVVEDDFLLRTSIAEFLTWSGGFEVKCAADGLEALTWLDSSLRKPSVILLDIALPRVDGIRFLALQKSLPKVANIPVIAMTGDARRSNLAALGFRDAFFKPLDLPKLLQTIRRL